MHPCHRRDLTLIDALLLYMRGAYIYIYMYIYKYIYIYIGVDACIYRVHTYNSLYLYGYRYTYKGATTGKQSERPERPKWAKGAYVARRHVGKEGYSETFFVAVTSFVGSRLFWLVPNSL